MSWLVIILLAAGCISKPTPTPTPELLPTSTGLSTPTELPTQTPVPPTATLVPTLPASTEQDLSKTVWKDFIITDFNAVHSPVSGDANEHLIFGKIPILPLAKDLTPNLASFLGRWEGYDYGPPAKKDTKGVLVIQEITNQGGKGYLWAASTLQYPFWVKEFQFKVIQGEAPSIEWEVDLNGGPDGMSGTAIVALSYDRSRELLEGSIKGLQANQNMPAHPLEFSRSQTFFVYQDYQKYFASKRIYPKEYRNHRLQEYGWGYLLYLPEDYEKEPAKKWPLIFFLCGTGERGEDIFLLAKHGPWNSIRQKGPLRFIIAAPMLHVSTAFRSFPENYMDGALDEVLVDYRVDQKRIYLTGLSMGGEATYRFALHRPETFAAIAPFSAFNPKYVPDTIQQGFKPFTLPMEMIKEIPVWEFHGTNDPIIPLAAAQSTVNDLIKAGGNVKFTILPGHDHDSWSEAYLDPSFYEWFLQYHKP